MPANAANFFLAIDKIMKGGPLNPSKLLNKWFSDSNIRSVPV